MTQLRRSLLLSAVAVCALAAAQSAHGATFTVNTTLDLHDALPGDGVCDDGNALCSLRGAIMEANALPAHAAHLIQIPPGVYDLIIPGIGEDGARRGDLDILVPLVLRGLSLDAADIVIQPNAMTVQPPDRVFHLLAAFDGVPVLMENMTIRGGLADAGAGILSPAGSILTLRNVVVEKNTARLAGGGIWSGGALLMSDTTLRENAVADAGCHPILGTPPGGGGGLFNEAGRVVIQSSTIADNAARQSCGGGILNNDGAVQLTNSTIFRNAAGGYGGGIFSIGQELVLSYCTVSFNETIPISDPGPSPIPIPAGGIFSLREASLTATIVSRNAPRDCSPSGNFTSFGFNLDSDNTCNLSAPLDLPATNPLLDPLADNGGPTQTQALNAGSPAIDFIPAPCVPLTAPILPIDQRHFMRPADGDGNDVRACDIGAFELRARPLIINEVDADSAGRDEEEFIEIYDGGAGFTRLDGLALVAFDGDTDATYDIAPFTGAIDLSGLATDAGGYLVIGNQGVPNATVITNPASLQNGSDAVAIYAGPASAFPAGTPVGLKPIGPTLLDAIVYGSNSPREPELTNVLTPGQPQPDEATGPHGALLDSNQRCPNGTGGQRMTGTYLAELPSPGLSNLCGAPIDEDGDGFPLGVDCDDQNAAVWHTPGEAQKIDWRNDVIFRWQPPHLLGGLAVVYDVLRSPRPFDFVNFTTCLVTDNGHTEAFDPDEPTPGRLLSYLVRAQNRCPVGEGSLGTSSSGVERMGISCP